MTQVGFKRQDVSDRFESRCPPHRVPAKARAHINADSAVDVDSIQSGPQLRSRKEVCSAFSSPDFPMMGAVSDAVSRNHVEWRGKVEVRQVEQTPKRAKRSQRNQHQNGHPIPGSFSGRYPLKMEPDLREGAHGPEL